MVAERSPQRMTVDAWRALERESRDAKHEFIDGHVSLMAGGSRAHSLVAVHALTLLSIALADGPCLAYNSDLATRLSPTRFTLPDVVVTCDERDAATRDETEIAAPRVVFEVLSDSTESYDRGVKFGYYRECPTVQEYVLVATNRQAVEVYRRTADGWGTFQVYGPGDEVVLTSIDVHFPLAALYRRTDVPEALSVHP